MEWNCNGSLLLVRWERTREAIHIYAFPQAPAEFKPSLRTVIQHRAGVRNARWNPVRAGSLVSCTGTGALYLWQDSSADWVNDEEMAECIGIPGKGFTTADVQWGPDGRSIVLQDKEMFTCAFVVEE